MDIYDHPFDHQRGHVRVCHPTVDLFLYRVEDLPRLDSPLAEFLGMPGFRVQRKNVGGEKSYNKAYRQLMATYVVPRKVLDELYATRYMRYFYSDEERARFKEYWSHPREA